MVKITKVNWLELNKIGGKFKDDTDEFDKIKNEIQSIINSLNECWQGIDSYNYRKSFSNYLTFLNKDVEYLDDWAAHFKKSSLRYGDSVEGGLNKVRNLNKQYDVNNNLNNLDLIEQQGVNINGRI